MEHVTGIELVARVNHLEQWQSVSECFTILAIMHLFPIDPYVSMNHELPSLSGAAGEQRSEYGSVQPSLNRRIHHIHVWSFRKRLWLFIRRRFKAGASPQCLLRAIRTSEISVVHGHDGAYRGPKHHLPLLLPYSLSMIGTCQCLCSPLLLEIGSVLIFGGFSAREVVEIVFAPRLANFLFKNQTSCGSAHW